MCHVAFQPAKFLWIVMILYTFFSFTACAEEEGVGSDSNQEASGAEVAHTSFEAQPTPPPLTEDQEVQDSMEEPLFENWNTEIDLVAWGLTPPPEEELSEGEQEIPRYLDSELCTLPHISFPITHPFAQGQEAPRPQERSVAWREDALSIQHVAHPQLSAQDSYQMEVTQRQKGGKQRKIDLVMPGFEDQMPLFERAQAWSEPRCYEVQPGEGRLLSEEEAYERYRRLVLETLWRNIDQNPEHRTVIGLRGAAPGLITWNYNSPNYYNDTLVLLWKDVDAQPHVLEFPVNTDTGAHDFGEDQSSSLRPNRHYPYLNDWHRDYNALRIDLASYPVRDDTNNNGHWDSDRNGWLMGPQAGLDYDRLGTAHNIHGAPASPPLAQAEINLASAGCQVIPGAQNWERFITQAWTGLGDSVDYYLIDVRDIPNRFFEPCNEQGTHACPYSIRTFPYQTSGDTSMSYERLYDVYSCATANEGGAEQVYVMNLPSEGLFRASVETSDPAIDPDLHLLEGDDAQACRARGHEVVEALLPAGRYVLIVDTYISAQGVELAGRYDLLVEWLPSP